MGFTTEEVKKQIEDGRTVLGIEFGSTRIKAVLVAEDNAPVATGAHDWENRLENGIWTYSLEDVWNGLQDCYRDLAADVKKQYGVELQKIGALGFSAMMHGYMAFDEKGELLVPFRTWRNTNTGPAALSYYAKMEHRASVSGSSERGRACSLGSFLYHTGRLCTLEAVGRESCRCRRSIRHVSDRYRDRRF